jgi:hypothetical protein
VPEEDVDAEGNRWPTKEELVNAKPIDFTTAEDWALRCEHWSTPKFRKASVRAKENRKAAGDEIFHRSGSRSLPAARQFLVTSTYHNPFVTSIMYSIQYICKHTYSCLNIGTQKLALTLDLVVLGCTIMNCIEGQMMVVCVAKVLQINGLATNYLFNNSAVPLLLNCGSSSFF